MDEFDDFSEHHEVTELPGQRFGAWVRGNRAVLLYGLLLLVVAGFRGLWAPGETGLGALVRNSPKAIDGPGSLLFLWLLKFCARVGEAIGFGTAWPLRLPAVGASLLFLFAYRTWASRFLQKDVAKLSNLVLCAMPLWFWQSQVVQVDLVFAAALGWSWLCWLAGYLLLRGMAVGTGLEHQGWFRKSYVWLGVALLLKGPLALVLSVPLWLAFGLWQRDLKVLKACSWSWLLGILALAVLFRGFLPALPMLKFGPLWASGLYLLRDLFPWTLLLPALGLFLRGSGAHQSPTVRFLMLAAVVPFLFSFWVEAGHGADPLLTLPFLALLLGGMLQPVYVEGVSLNRIRRLGGIMAAGLWLAALVAVAPGFIQLGGPEIQAALSALAGPLRLASLVLALGALSVSVRCSIGEGEFLVRETAATLCAAFLILGTWGFHRLDRGRCRSFPVGDAGPSSTGK